MLHQFQLELLISVQPDRLLQKSVTFPVRTLTVLAFDVGQLALPIWLHALAMERAVRKIQLREQSQLLQPQLQQQRGRAGRLLEELRERLSLESQGQPDLPVRPVQGE